MIGLVHLSADTKIRESMVTANMPGSKIIGVGTVKGDPKISVGSWVMIIVILALLLLPLLTLTVAFICSQKANAQTPQELYWYYWTQAAQRDAANNEKSRVKVMLDNVYYQLSNYYDKNKSLPRFDPDMDKFMTGSYKKIMSQDPDSTWAPTASGSHRSFGSMRMFYDAGAANLTKINDKYQLPESWKGDPKSIVVVTDGADHAVTYYTGDDQKPLVFSVIDLTPGDNDDDNNSQNPNPTLKK